MNLLIERLNCLGGQALQFAWPMLWQSSLLILALFAVDLLLQRWTRAAIRHALWLILILKLLLPPSLALPTGAGWWLRPAAGTPAAPAAGPITFVSHDSATAPVVQIQEVPPSPPQPHARISAAGTALLVSVAVSLALITWMLVRWRQAVQVAQSAVAAPAWLDRLLDELRRSFKVKQVVRLRLADRVISPAVCGLFRPTILLPRLLLDRLSAAQLRAVLLHELFHLRRGDAWINCAQALLQTVYWWHALLWLANDRIRRVREESVDDAVMLALEGEADAYAPTLLQVARFAVQRPLASLGLVGILESKRALRRRVERLISFRPPRKAGISFLSVLAIASFAAVAVPMGEAPAKVHLLSQGERHPLSAVALADEQTSADDNVKPSIKRATEAEGAESSEQGLPEINLSSLPSARQLIAARLRHIRLESVKFDDMRLDQVILFLINEAKEHDSEKRGVNFLINPTVDSTAIDPNSGLPFAQVAPIDINSIRINLPRPLQDVSLAEVLNAIVRVASNRIRYSIQDYAVVFSLRTEQGPASLYTRMIKVDPNTFMQGLQSVVAAPSGIGPSVGHGGVPIALAIRQFFLVAGVDLSPPGVFYYNETEGTLLIRAPLKDLEIIEAAVGALNSGTARIPETRSGTPTETTPAKNAGTNSSGLNQKLPVLGDVPLVGNLFHSESGAAAEASPPAQKAVEAQAPGASTLRAAETNSYFQKGTGTEPTPLYTRAIRIDSSTFMEYLESMVRGPSGTGPSIAGGGVSIESALRQFCAAAGVDLSPPSSIHFKPAESTLWIRAPLNDLDLIQAALGRQNAEAAKRGMEVRITARFVTIMERDLRALGFGWYQGKSPGPPAARSLVKASDPQTVTAILSDEQFRADFQKLERQKGTDVLATSTVTTRSGQLAQIQVGETKTVVNGIKWPLPLTSDPTAPTNVLPTTYLTDTIILGPKLDVLPTIAADGSTIQLKLTPTVMEFLGYDAPSPLQMYDYDDNNLPHKNSRATLPLPHFRLRSVEAEATVRDGQTLVLASPKITDISAQQMAKSPSKPNQKEKGLIVFVTTTLLDSAGNPVHGDK